LTSLLNLSPPRVNSPVNVRAAGVTACTRAVGAPTGCGKEEGGGVVYTQEEGGVLCPEASFSLF